MAATSEGKLNILLAEDNPADVFLIRESLKQHCVDCTLDVVENGEQALARLRSLEAKSGAGSPDLVVLDLNLPRVDGAELLQRIRDTPGIANLPVVIFTSSDSPLDRQNAAVLGAKYIRKPSNLDEYMEIGLELKRLGAKT